MSTAFQEGSILKSFILYFVKFLRFVLSDLSVCILKVEKLVSMVQGSLGPLMYCLMPRKSFSVNLESILLFTIWQAAWRGEEADSVQASIYLV